MINSFPRIYDIPSTEERLAARTVIYTDTNVSVQVKSLRSQVSWWPGVTERETLASELADIEDAFKHGWSSDSDEDNDDL